jgi:PEP-CTERM motif
LFGYGPFGGSAGNGGAATATANSTAGEGGAATAAATASGGAAGNGGDATATADSIARGGGAATATATADGGAGGGCGCGVPGTGGAANASSTATADHGAIAQAQSTAVGSSGQAQSTANTSFTSVRVQSKATAPTGSTATTNAIAQAGGSGQALSNPGQTAYAFAVGDPDKAYSTALIGGASNVAGALLGPRDAIFGAAILGANYAPDGDGESQTCSAAATFDFGYGGDVKLGLIDDQQSGFTGGAGFQSIEFTVSADGSTILDKTFSSLMAAASYFQDQVIDLGSTFGPGVDLTFGYNLTADGSGGYGFDLAVDGAVPEPSTWAMMAIGFLGLAGLGLRVRRRAMPPDMPPASRNNSY